MRTADTVGRQFEVESANVKSKEKSPVSMMPEGLVDEFSLGQIHGLDQVPAERAAEIGDSV